MSARFALVELDVLAHQAGVLSRGSCDDATGAALAALVARRAVVHDVSVDGDEVRLLVGDVRLVLTGAGDQPAALRRGRWKLDSVRWRVLDPVSAVSELRFSRGWRKLTVRCDRVSR